MTSVKKLPNELIPGQVVLCLADLSEVTETRVRRYAPLLSAQELAANHRFSQLRLRQRDILCRGMLRELLAAHLDLPAAGVPLTRSESGKPQLDSDKYSLKFNYSHSGDYVLYALALDLEVGVDIEQAIARRNAMGIAKSFFSATEHEALLQLPVDERDAAFFRYWTLKEAYLKARGEGISAGLAGFAFLFDPQEPDSISITFPDARSDQPQHWTFFSQEPVPGYRAGVAVRTGGATCSCAPVRLIE